MRERLHLAVYGAVQGVSFRPFVYRIARELGLAGWVRNSPHGVFIEVEGAREVIDCFLTRLHREPPGHTRIVGIETTWLDAVRYDGFEIRESRTDGAGTPLVLPDIATCDDCRNEIFDPTNRRFRYPFTTCTHCGPRFTILRELPYDRPNTTMHDFVMCEACRDEYLDPSSRRFHAQPNACPLCGPHVALWDHEGRVVALGDAAVGRAVAALAAGDIVAVKGIGGFHLMVDARLEDAVARLRRRKRREDKPFAVMYPSLQHVRRDCDTSALELRLLRSAEAPIVLLRKHPNHAKHLAPGIAPANPYLGVMLPYSPLHHLLLADLRHPVVATSGKAADEPICTDEHEALARLAGIADHFLVHNRPIARQVDDSLVRVMLGREMVLRRARGYAPMPVHLRTPGPPIVAVGGRFNNAVVVATDEQAFISQQSGELDSEIAEGAFRQALASVESLYRVAPQIVLADQHPGYVSTEHARNLGLPMIQVQHQYAHVAACMAENDLEGCVLGVSWDGSGHGGDGTIWGGEFLLTDHRSFLRVGTMRPFRLAGGDAARHEPRRSALGVLYEVFGTAAFDLPCLAGAFSGAEARRLRETLPRGVDAPLTSSAGRLFDAVASIVGLRHRASYDGQAAFALECAVDERCGERYPFTLDGAVVPFVIDWVPMIRAIVEDVDRRVPRGVIAASFHNTLAAIVRAAALRVAEPRLVLTGGCFQNRILTERVVAALTGAGFRAYWHQRVPPSDGGLALGQVAAFLRAQQRAAEPVDAV